MQTIFQLDLESTEILCKCQEQFKNSSVLSMDCSSDFQVLFSTAGLTNCLFGSSGLMGRPFVFSPRKLTSEKLIPNHLKDWLFPLTSLFPAL